MATREKGRSAPNGTADARKNRSVSPGNLPRESERARESERERNIEREIAREILGFRE